ncbi:energy transducer TonB [Empedobacter falsenii]|uniref:energy transducer TonB family protein n=1 Tax=Empedobacter falsenii TaxID=343874 RepID=UPI002578C317|nr:energy transducer TonB [Empedobacter falsenii]MDM1298048.1 energy transducer TonB [Empedobacter falsenii]MDM1317877.1 energy transducer TonB [Empedobacter falsenii]
MKKLSLLAIVIAQFAFGQKIYTKDQVEKLPTYKECTADKKETCFAVKLSSQINEELIDYANKLPSGNYVSKINFTIDENGKFTNLKYTGNDELGKKALKALEIIGLRQEMGNTNVIPASINGKPVKMYYTLPVKIAVEG